MCLIRVNKEFTAFDVYACGKNGIPPAGAVLLFFFFVLFPSPLFVYIGWVQSTYVHVYFIQTRTMSDMGDCYK